jgi:trimethylamine--corrinoid protein Co-methyltransferase
MRRLQLAVRGSREAMIERPMTIYSCCPSAPLKWNYETSDNVAECAKDGVPVEFISMPLTGACAPVTLIGSLVQHTAETLSGVVISQASRPGAPVLYGGSPGSFDMRTGTACICSVEAQMMSCSFAQIGRSLGLPTQAYIGFSDCRASDMQAGHETGTGLYLAAMTGINSISGPGMLDNESCSSLEKLVVDNEWCGMAKRLVRGVSECMLYDIPETFGELLSDGSMLASEHTMENFRSEHYVPGPAVDRSFGPGPEMVDRARSRVDELVDAYEYSSELSDDQVRDLCDALGDDELASKVRGELGR